MGRDRKNEHRTERFAKWIYGQRLLPAWKALSFPAREVYFHLAVRCLAETAAKKGNVPNNNGEVYRSPRDLAGDMGCTPRTAMSGVADLQAKGWIVCTSHWERGYDGKGRTALFRLTMMPTEKKWATGEPERWSEGYDFPVKVYAAYKPKARAGRSANLEKQNPPPRSDALRR